MEKRIVQLNESQLINVIKELAVKLISESPEDLFKTLGGILMPEKNEATPSDIIKIEAELNLVKDEKDPMAYWVYFDNKIIGNVAGIGRFGDWSWSLDTEKIDTTSTYGVLKNKEDAAKKVYMAHLNKK